MARVLHTAGNIVWGRVPICVCMALRRRSPRRRDRSTTRRSNANQPRMDRGDAGSGLFRSAVRPSAVKHRGAKGAAPLHSPAISATQQRDAGTGRQRVLGRERAPDQVQGTWNHPRNSREILEMFQRAKSGRGRQGLQRVHLAGKPGAGRRDAGQTGLCRRNPSDLGAPTRQRHGRRAATWERLSNRVRNSTGTDRNALP